MEYATTNHSINCTNQLFPLVVAGRIFDSGRERAGAGTGAEAKECGGGPAGIGRGSFGGPGMLGSERGVDF